MGEPGAPLDNTENMSWSNQNGWTKAPLDNTENMLWSNQNEWTEAQLENTENIMMWSNYLPPHVNILYNLTEMGEPGLNRIIQYKWRYDLNKIGEPWLN